jgi:quinol monooxygenase YgiN
LEEGLKAMIPHVQTKTGAVAYILHRAENNPSKFFFYEKYTDK